MNSFSRFSVSLAGLVAALSFCPLGHAADPLPSWNDGAAKQSIVKFVEGVTREGSPDFVPVPERIATFDNDGTLWAEQPLYFQLFFLVDQVKAMAPQHPEWKTQEPFATVLKGDPRGITAGGEAGMAALLTATHSGMTTDEFSRSSATGSRPRSTRRPASRSRPWSTSRCSSSWTTCARTDSRRSSSRAAASSSCGPGRRRSTASRPSR